MHPDPSESLFHFDSSKLSSTQNLQLTKNPDAQEIKSVVFALKAESSPGLDGFSGGLFTATWHITGNFIIKAVQHFFSSGKLFKVSNVYF